LSVENVYSYSEPKMSTELRIQTQVLPGHRIEVTPPEILEGTTVDVMVVEHEANRPLTATEIRRLPLEERNKILEKAAEEMVEYYESTADERVEWQGETSLSRQIESANCRLNLWHP
jgi:acyl-CoA reductase-like NAD-dependent aldehyde dehydrogenase